MTSRPDTDLCLSFISNPGTQSSNAPASHSENTRQLGFITVSARYTLLGNATCTPRLRYPEIVYGTEYVHDKDLIFRLSAAP